MEKETVAIFSFKGPATNDMTGGIEVYELELAKVLEKMGYNIEIFCGKDHDENSPDQEQISENIRVRRYKAIFGFLPFALISMHLSFFFKHKKNINFLIENQSVIPMFTTFYRKSRLTIIHHITGKDYYRKQGKIKGSIGYYLEKFFLPKLYKKQSILTVSDHTKSQLVELGFNRDAVKVIPPVVNVKPSEIVFHPRENIISYIGRYTGLQGNKKIDHIIDVLPEIIDSVPDAKLIIAGSMKKEDELKKRVENLNLNEKVSFLGFISDEKKSEILAMSKVFASPSYQEGFGITYIESNINGTPVVGYKIPDLMTVTDSSGIMVEKDDKDSLKEAIITLLLDDEKWNLLSKGAYENADKYSSYRVKKALKLYLRNILDN